MQLHTEQNNVTDTEHGEKGFKNMLILCFGGSLAAKGAGLDILQGLDSMVRASSLGENFAKTERAHSTAS